jgi:hypothetical protein
MLKIFKTLILLAEILLASCPFSELEHKLLGDGIALSSECIDVAKKKNCFLVCQKVDEVMILNGDQDQPVVTGVYAECESPSWTIKDHTTTIDQLSCVGEFNVL